MKKPTNQPIIISIDRLKLSLCSAVHAAPINFNFPLTAISDLEIINRDELRQKLQVFLEQSQVHPAPLVIILAQSTYFDKLYPGAVPPAREEMQKFLDKMPFSAVGSKLFKIPGGFRLVAINRDFYEAFSFAFESLGFKVSAAVPIFVLEPIGVKQEFTAQACLVISKKLDFVLANSFSGPAEPQNIGEKKQAFFNKYSTSIAIVSVAFMVFSGIMIYLTFSRSSAPPPISASQKVITPPPPIPTASPTPTPAPDLSRLKVQVINSSGVSGRAAAIQKLLQPLGITQVTTSTSRSAVTGRSLVVFSSAVTPAERELLVNALSPSLPDITIRENPASQFDISITIAKTAP